MRTIHSLAISVFGSNLSELNAAKEFQAILAARQQTANIAKGIIDSSLASSSDNIH